MWNVRDRIVLVCRLTGARSTGKLGADSCNKGDVAYRTCYRRPYKPAAVAATRREVSSAALLADTATTTHARTV